jgi:uncharacterized membrane protein
MSELAESLRETFRQIGLRIGQELAQQMAAQLAEAMEDEPYEDDESDYGEPAVPAVAHPAPPRAGLMRSRLLPGLSGRRRKPGEPAPLCGKPGCERPSRTRGYCQTHYVQWLRGV